MRMQKIAQLAVLLVFAVGILSSCVRDAHNDIIQFALDQSPDIAWYSDTLNVDFSAQYVRTNSIYEGVTYPAVKIVRSADELSAYYEQNRGFYNLERNPNPATDSTIGFLDACDKYDDAFFEKNALAMVLLEEGSGSTRHKVDSVSLENSKMQIKIDTITPEVGTCDMAQWHIIVETEKTVVPSDVNDIEIYIDSVYCGVEEFVYVNQESEQPGGYCGNTQTTIYFDDNTSYCFMYDESVTLTDMLVNLDYDTKKLCRCLPEYKIETEFGTYGVKLSTEGYVRCDKGQAELTQEQQEKISKIISWAKDNAK